MAAFSRQQNIVWSSIVRLSAAASKSFRTARTFARISTRPALTFSATVNNARLGNAGGNSRAQSALPRSPESCMPVFPEATCPASRNSCLFATARNRLNHKTAARCSGESSALSLFDNACSSYSSCGNHNRFQDVNHYSLAHEGIK